VISGDYLMIQSPDEAGAGAVFFSSGFMSHLFFNSVEGYLHKRSIFWGIIPDFFRKCIHQNLQEGSNEL
jgi:hypothetical protein